jgi:hypothetical protein
MRQVYRHEMTAVRVFEHCRKICTALAVIETDFEEIFRAVFPDYVAQ